MAQLETPRFEILRLLEEQYSFLHKIMNESQLLRSGQKRNLNTEEVQAWVNTLQGEIRKVEKLEMTVAVVGTMKAGKSTTINSIVGTEILPNRNQPMTTLPTLIRHTPGQKIPKLTFAKPEPFNKAIDQLKEAIEDMQAKELLYNFSDCNSLIHDILYSNISIKNSYEGNTEIYDFLKVINDISRICEDNRIGIDSPLKSYNHIEELPIINIEFFHLKDQIIEGQFTLIDTPGPNEAGQKYLKKILDNQLRKATVVLSVLDYTQLNSEADEEVRRLLNEIQDFSKERLFVLINKFDQKDRNGMDENEVKAFVSNKLFDGKIEIQRIFPVSSKFAYLSNRALIELLSSKKLNSNDLNNNWVIDFGQVVFGRLWRNKIDNYLEVQAAAEVLWEDSLFDILLNTVIRQCSKSIIDICLLSAVSKMWSFNKKLLGYLELRSNAIHVNITELKHHVNSLMLDIVQINTSKELARTYLKEQIEQLKLEIDHLFSENSRIVREKIINKFYNEEKLIEERQAQFKENDSVLLKFKNVISNSASNKVGYMERANTFEDEEKAKKFITKLNNDIEAIVIPAMKNLDEITYDKINILENSLWKGINDTVSPKMKTVQERIKKTFSVKLSFHNIKPNMVKSNMQVISANAINESYEMREGSDYQRKWYSLWIYKHKVKYEYLNRVFKVYLYDIAQNVIEQLAQTHEQAKMQIHSFVEKDIQKQVDDFFEELSQYLENLKGDLLDAINDRELKEKELIKHKEMMDEYQKLALKHQESLQPFLESI